MGLQAAFDLELSAGENVLQRIRRMACQQLKAATRSHRHPWHTGVVATVCDDRPRLRTVVLRAATESPLILRFHTDSRSCKVMHLQQNPELEWLFYEPSTRIQLRVGATASIRLSGTTWEQAWERTSLSSRRCYLAPQPPGTKTTEANVNLPPELTNRDPTLEESQVGSANFAIVECVAHSLEWLYLKHTGHLRCGFSLSDSNQSKGSEWTGSWLAP